jgi:hypothetical protein
MKPTRNLLSLLVASTCFAGCSHTDAYVQAAPSEPAPVYVVEIVGAELEPARPDGQPWDLETSDEPTRLTGFSLHTPLGGISVSMGPPRAPRLPVPGAPDAKVTLTFEGRRVETPPSHDSYTPAWGYRFLIDPLMDPDGMVTIQVADEDGDHLESLGARTFTMRELLSGSGLELGPFGSVRRLELTVTRESEDRLAPFETAPISVASTLGGWVNTGIQVYSGMHIAMAAEGKVRVSRLTSGYWGPEGVTDPNLQSRWQSHNVEGFEAAPHGALIACVVDPTSQSVTQRLVIGDGVLTRLDGSGILLIGINDTDPSNNAGAFQVRVGGGARMPVEAVARPLP